MVPIAFPPIIVFLINDILGFVQSTFRLDLDSSFKIGLIVLAPHALPSIYLHIRNPRSQVQQKQQNIPGGCLDVEFSYVTKCDY